MDGNTVNRGAKGLAAEAAVDEALKTASESPRHGSPHEEAALPAAIVTGATGFIGAALCRALLARGWRVYALVRPRTDRRSRLPDHPQLRCFHGCLEDPEPWTSELRRLAGEGERFAAFFHLAWHGVGGQARNDCSQLANIAWTVQTVGIAAKLGCRLWIGAGSQAEYGRLEGRADESHPEAPTTLYGRAKLEAGRQALAAAAAAELTACWVRVFSVYGPDDDEGWFIPGLAAQLLEGDTPRMTPGLQRWDYLYVDDAASAFAALAEAPDPPSGVYNLGSGESRTIRDIAALVRDAAAPGAELRFGALPYRRDQVMHLEADTAKLAATAGWQPRVPLAEGIARTVRAERQRLERKKRLSIKRSIVTMAYRSGSSHVGTALSCADILYALYFRVMRIDPGRPDAPERDKLVLSKAHGSTALYATLAERGYFPREWLDEYAVDGGRLPGHLDRESAPGIDASAGSLGHGLPVAVGLALADRLAGRDSRTFAVLGDGECNEGSVWEAAMMASALRLGGLTAVVDCNGWQGFGRTEELQPFDRLRERWSSFGWETAVADGHDIGALAETLAAPSSTGAPKAVLARTVKGYGVDFMADTLEWHYRSPNGEQWREALRQLGGDAK
ncbi:NAD-dependent epimerase/dehydratase family protein [Paenibacillus thermoaerophilus]|uniref:NAD-dependent epimerase/dehydratase family protein n=1 Tax=Paenibacillus thermoaerophilus TaxID=1215385 RepID=A0ABW2V4N6_9BACL|nr:NAD-dependent epimerase/dehydratase family protein [Paenibacillus thermoaerophilus]TMV07352.1 NAD-dependent epimerase/dehydratase family protein [Paenibacillus thermoaerophilus]